MNIGFLIPIPNSFPPSSRWGFIAIGVLLSCTILLTIPGILLIVMGLTLPKGTCPVCGNQVTYHLGVKAINCCYCHQRLFVKGGLLTTLDGKTHHPAKQKAKDVPHKKSNEVFIWIGIFLFMAIFLKSVILGFLINMALLFIVSGILYPIFSVIHRASNSEYVNAQNIFFKKMFVWSALLLVFSLIIYGFTSLPSTNDSATQSTAVPTKEQSQNIRSAENPTAVPTKTVSSSSAKGKPQCDPAQLLSSEFDACLQKNYPLPATVKADDTYFYVTNPTNINWTGCSMEQSNGDYQMNGYDNFDVPAGSTASVEWGRMKDQNGNRFIYSQMQPGAINITCFEGKEMHESAFRGF